ncbi:3-hydroxyacyl-CoA dehydrogenase NAD-binding domain-containing protein [Aliamphritea spongicola]|nr:3-hydroxyacyl-CoA dehydrogenase NAD-binding domain-containing protein [Aliamphritea spongicola]
MTEIRTVAVVGAGTMGSGIALAFAGAGVNVLLLENSEDALQRGLSSIAASVDKAVGRGIFTPAKAETILAAIQPMRDKSELQSVDMLIEAVFEDMQVKQKLFAGYQQHCRDNVIWATNTSYLDINEIATAVERPENLLGVHFFSPANIMPLVEVVDADKTSTETLSTVMNLLKKMRKISVISGVCHGFIGNRMYQAYQREAGLLLMNGATPRQIDKALTDFGMAMGPFAVVDMSGIDIGYMMRQSLAEGAYEKHAFLVHDRLVETGRKGRKTGAGFYNYDDGGHLQDDPAVLELIEQIAAEQGAERREISDAEIIDRCILALMNEAGHILDEGIARSAADVDVVFVNGYGFPRAKGGPMFYAQSRGLSACAKKVAEFASTQGPRWWRPSQALAAAAEAGRW